MNKFVKIFLLINSLALIGFFADVEYAKRASIAASNRDWPTSATPFLPDAVALWCLAVGILGACISVRLVCNDHKQDNSRKIKKAAFADQGGLRHSLRDNIVKKYPTALLLINSLSLIILFCDVDAERRSDLTFLAETAKVLELQNPRPVALICLAFGIVGACSSIWLLRPKNGQVVIELPGRRV